MGVALFIVYALLGKIVYEILQRRGGRDADAASYDGKLNIFFAIIWPLTIFGLVYYLFGRPYYQGTPTPREFFFSDKTKVPDRDDNRNPIGKAKEYDAEDMEAFIRTLERRPDTPLSGELTFSYKVTGVSRTYPAGTPFPSALINDWKRGFYMGDVTEEQADSEQADS